MLSIYGQVLALCTSILAAAAIVLGARFVLRHEVSPSAELRLGKLFAFGAGVIFVAVVLDFLPDAWELAANDTPWGIFSGILLLWVLTQWVDRTFSHHQVVQSLDSEAGRSAMIQFTFVSAVVLAVSLSVHSFLEGAALAVATHEVTVSSIIFVVAMILHKLPEGILWGLALQTAMPNAVAANPKRVWYTLMIPAACTLLGTVTGITFLHFASSQVIAILSAVLCGALIFICFSELFPMLRDSARSVPVNRWFFGGIVTMMIPLAIGMLVRG